jgi:hypothetical protein
MEHEEDVRNGGRLKQPSLLRQPLLGAEMIARIASELSLASRCRHLPYTHKIETRVRQAARGRLAGRQGSP